MKTSLDDLARRLVERLRRTAVARFLPPRAPAERRGPLPHDPSPAPAPPPSPAGPPPPPPRPPRPLSVRSGDLACAAAARLSAYGAPPTRWGAEGGAYVPPPPPMPPAVASAPAAQSSSPTSAPSTVRPVQEADFETIVFRVFD